MRLTAVQKVSTILKINDAPVDAIDILTMRGLETIASCLGSASDFTGSWMSYISLGQGEKNPSTEDKYLENELYRQLATISYSENVYTANTVFSGFSSTFILREVGMQDSLVGGNLGARWLLTSDIDIAIADSVDVTCLIYIV